MSGERERDARNQELFREVNEQIGELATRLDIDGRGSYICECGDTRCTQPVALTRSEYEALREHANRFAVVPGHENPQTERVVEQHSGYTVVEALAAG